MADEMLLISDEVSWFCGAKPNLSGCTYREGGSWRKFDLKGYLAEVRMDATLVWPFIQQFALEAFRRAA